MERMIIAQQSRNLLLAGVTTAFLVVAYLNISAASSRAEISSSSSKKDSKEYPAEIKEELLARVTSFFGEDGVKKLKSSFIIVVGLGGVGSHCAHMLVRSGVGKLRLIDFDQVTLSSLNRHAVAVLSDVGISKAEAMRRRLQDIVPWCEIDARTAIFKMDQAADLLADRPDFVIDCIDDVNTKAELIAYCKANNIQVVTSMGAGGKADPTRLRIAPLSDCINDPLSQKIKWKLKKHSIAAEDVMSIFSIEKPICNLLPLDEEQRQSPQDYGTVDYLRLRIMPVLGTSPAIFGQALASYILCSLAGKMYEPEACERMSKNLKHKLRQVYRNNEIKRFGHDEDMNIDDEDVEFIVLQVWRGRCAVTGKRFGGHILPTLTRWRADQPPSPYNLVLMMQTEAQKLMEQGQEVFGEEMRAKIEGRLRWAQGLLEAEDMKLSEINTLSVKNKGKNKLNSMETSFVPYITQALCVVGGGCLGALLVQNYN